MNELDFKEEVLKLGENDIKYEWAVRQFGDRHDLVFHFFLGEGQENPKFFRSLTRAVVKIGINSEVSYTEDFDGHDVVMCNIQPWQADALKSQLIRSIKDAYSNSGEKS